jgi:hypothetical protein
MAFQTRGRWGAGATNPPPERCRDVLQELDIAADDLEHPDVCLAHDSGWALSAFPCGLLVWENAEDETHAPRHMTGVSRARVLALWLRLAEGNVAAVDTEPWQLGYGPLSKGS